MRKQSPLDRYYIFNPYQPINQMLKNNFFNSFCKSPGMFLVNDINQKEKNMKFKNKTYLHK